MQSNHLPSHYSDNKATRKYVKTGKYSKKKQQQAQQQIQAAIQQQIQAALQSSQQPLTPQQIAILQQSLQAAAMGESTNSTGGLPEGINVPALSPQQLANFKASFLQMASQPFLPRSDLTNSTTGTNPILPMTRAGALSVPLLHPNPSQSTLPPSGSQNIQTIPLSSSAINSNISDKAGFPQQMINGTITTKEGMPLSTASTKPVIFLGNNVVNPSEEGLAHNKIVKKRYTEALQKDHEKITKPDYTTPFKSIEDVIDRLLPYHIYQYPLNDLNANKIPMERQGKINEKYKSYIL